MKRDGVIVSVEVFCCVIRSCCIDVHHVDTCLRQTSGQQAALSPAMVSVAFANPEDARQSDEMPEQHAGS